jgi:hypothetical protein
MLRGCEFDCIVLRVPETGPRSTDSLACGRGFQFDVESDFAIRAFRFADPQLLGRQQPLVLDVLDDRELKAPLAIQIPGGLQMWVHMHSVTQVAPMSAPSDVKFYRTADIDLAVLAAADLVNAGRGWNVPRRFA